MFAMEEDSDIIEFICPPPSAPVCRLFFSLIFFLHYIFSLALVFLRLTHSN